MNAKVPGQSTVLRQPGQGLGGRRLPVMGASAGTPQDAAPAPALDVLRTTFAHELAALKEQAFAEGLAAARQAFEKQAATELAQQQQAWLKKEAALRQALDSERTRLVALANQLQSQGAQMAAAMAPAVGRLALAVVARMLGQHATHRSLVADMAGQAIETYQLEAPLRIRVAAADHAGLQASAEGLFQLDPAAAPGSCLIDYGLGQLDAGLDIQWAALRALLASDPGGAADVASA